MGDEGGDVSVLNVSSEAHGVVRERAELAGVSMTQWASDKLLGAGMELTRDTMALLEERCRLWDCSPEEVILRLLTEPARARIVPLAQGVLAQVTREILWADGKPGCRCDGLEESGPWHDRGCWRRT